MRSPERAAVQPYSSFLGVPLGAVEDVRPGSFVISGAPFDSEILARFGAHRGPNGIRTGSQLVGERLHRAEGKDLMDVETGERFSPRFLDRVLDVGDFTMYPTDILKSQESIANGVADVVRRGGFSMMFGGDHYVSYPSAMGWHRAKIEQDPDIRIGYVHFDGHLDFGNYNPLTGSLNQGTNARRISELHRVQRKNMAWIGVTCLVNADQFDQINAMGGAIFTAETIHELGPKEVARRACEHAIRGCNVIYCTLDIDIVDPGYLPGTGVSDPSGVTPTQLREMLAVLTEYPLDAMDIMEVSPRLDPSGRSTSLAAEMALTVAMKKLS